MAKKRFILKFSLTVALLLAVSGVLLFTLDLGFLKGLVESQVSKATGREFSIAGDLSIRLGRQVEVSATDIRLANPAWAVAPDMAHIGELHASVDFRSLLEGPIVFEHLSVSGARLWLEDSASGEHNWVFGVPTVTVAGPSPPGAQVLFRHVEIGNLEVQLTKPERGKPLTVVIDSLSQRHRPDDLLDLNVIGSISGQAVEYHGVLGPFEHLLTGTDIQYKGEGLLGSLKFEGEGYLDDLAAPRHPTFNLVFNGPEISDVTSMLGLGELGTGPYRIAASARESGDALELDLDGSIGSFKIDLDGITTGITDITRSDVRISASGPDLGAFTRLLGLGAWPSEPFDLLVAAHREGDQMDVSSMTLNIGGTQFNLNGAMSSFPHLHNSRLDLNISGQDIAKFRELLGFHGVAEGPFELHAKLDISPEGVELVQVDASVSVGQASVSGTLGPGPDYVGTVLNVSASGPDANALLGGYGIEGLPADPFSLDTRFEVMEDGIDFEQGVLVNLDEDRLEIEGFVSFTPLEKGTDFRFRVSGDDASQFLLIIGSELPVPDQPYDLAGRFRATEEGFRLDELVGGIGSHRIEVDGLVTRAEGLVGSNISSRISGADASELTSMANLDFPLARQPYDLAAGLRITEEGYHLDDLSLDFGPNRIELDGLLPGAEGLVGTDFTFSASGPNLETLFQDIPEFDIPALDFKASGHVQLLEKSLLVGVFKLSIGALNANADLAVNLPFDSSNGRFSLNASGPDISVVLPEFEDFLPDPNPFEIHARGSMNDGEWTFETANIRIGDSILRLQGVFDELPDFSTTDLTFETKIPDPASLGLIRGERLASVPVEVTAHFSGTVDKFHMDDLTAQIGDTDIDGSLIVSFGSVVPRLVFKTRSEVIDLAALVPDSDETEAETPTGPGDGRLIPDFRFPLEKMASVNASVDIDANELRLKGRSYSNFTLAAELEDGTLRVTRARGDGLRGDMLFTGSLEPSGDGAADVAVDLAATGLVLNFSDQHITDIDQLPVLNVEFQAQGRGDGLREVAGSLNGHLHANSTGGVIPNSRLSAIDMLFFKQLISVVRPSSDEAEDFHLECFATKLDITDGVVQSNPGIALKTPKVQVLADGKVDLKSEKINLNFQLTPNKAYKASAAELINPFIKITGTLSNVKVSLNKTSTLLYGGAAVGTGGLSILAKGLLDRLKKSRDPCAEYMKAPDSDQ